MNFKYNALHEKRATAKKLYVDTLKEREQELREQAKELEKKDKLKKDAKIADELRKEKQRFQTDLDNFEKMASKEGD